MFPFFDYLNTPLYKSQLSHNKSKSFRPSGLVIKVKRNHHCFHHVFIARFHISDVGSEGIVRKKKRTLTPLYMQKLDRTWKHCEH